MSNGEKNIELLVRIKALTGKTLRLTPFESIDQIKTLADGSQIGILITTYRVVERKADLHITCRGKRLVSLARVNGEWTESQIVHWEDNFTPFFVNHYGPGKTPNEAVVQRARERMAGRPGSSRSPLDSFHRTTQGYSTPRMQRHW